MPKGFTRRQALVMCAGTAACIATPSLSAAKPFNSIEEQLNLEFKHQRALRIQRFSPEDCLNKISRVIDKAKQYKTPRTRNQAKAQFQNTQDLICQDYKYNPEMYLSHAIRIGKLDCDLQTLVHMEVNPDIFSAYVPGHAIPYNSAFNLGFETTCDPTISSEDAFLTLDDLKEDNNKPAEEITSETSYYLKPLTKEQELAKTKAQFAGHIIKNTNGKGRLKPYLVAEDLAYESLKYLPNNHSAYATIAVTALAQQDHKRAMLFIERAKELHPTSKYVQDKYNLILEKQ